MEASLYSHRLESSYWKLMIKLAKLSIRAGPQRQETSSQRFIRFLQAAVLKVVRKVSRLGNRAIQVL
jgi:hypothetical protein